MSELTAMRTLVKSPPELWSEVSEEGRLAQHLDAFGDVSITQLEPERTVAWEGERASGTVQIEPSGWGTKVTLTAALPDPPEEPAAEEPAAEEPAAERPRRGFWARLLRGPEFEPEPEAEAEAEPEPQPQPEPVATEEPVTVPLDPQHAQAALDEVLDALGAAHHRPFSRG
jgi:hypothetical protein